MKVSVIGLGKLGSPMVASMANAGHTIIGVDVNQKYVEAIDNGTAPVTEPLLTPMLKKNRARISATTETEKAVAGTDITFVIVPTPSKSTGDFDTAFAVSAMKRIGSALKTKKKYHLVVLTSTVLPGASKRDIIPALERASGKKVGKDFGFCYNPEFIALGSVIYNLLNPDFILIGESDTKAGTTLERFYSTYCMNKPPVRRMSVVNAELTKISVNTYVTAKISFANLLAEMCQKLPGGDVDVVAEAVGSDARVGRKYLKGAVGFGGPCFPRDNRAMQYLASTLGINHRIACTTDDVNAAHLAFLISIVMAQTKRGDAVAVLGLSYKPDTGVIEESQSVRLAAELIKSGRKVSVYDPNTEAMQQARAVIPQALFASSLIAAVHNQKAVCIATPWDEFRNLSSSQLSKGTIVFDFWRHLSPSKLKRNRHVLLGKSSSK